MKRWILAVMIGMVSTAFGQGSFGEVIGAVKSKSSNEGIYGAQVYIEDGGHKYQAITDADGKFRISAVPAGDYFLNIKYFGDTMSRIKAKVPMDGYCNLGDIKFESGVLEILAVDVVADDGSIKLEYGELPVKQLSADEIDKSPMKFDIKGLVTSMSSEVRRTEDGELVFRGARKGDMIYLMDGVKASDIGNVPGVAIGRMMVYTGGLPAKYGDTLGGVVVMETKSYFDLYREWESEQIRKGNK
jgi:hypothetical protein